MSSDERPSKPCWSVIEPFWNEIEIYEGPEIFARTFSSVPRPAGLLFAAHFCQSEICNGGFRQFFSNSTGVLAPEAIEGFNAIGQDFVAGIIQEACSLFGQPFPRERSLRLSKLEAIDSQLLDSLNEKFYGIIGSENGGFESAANNYAVKVVSSGQC
jgi:Domain of unknown function (DUF4375)